MTDFIPLVNILARCIVFVDGYIIICRSCKENLKQQMLAENLLLTETRMEGQTDRPRLNRARNLPVHMINDVKKVSNFLLDVVKFETMVN